MSADRQTSEPKKGGRPKLWRESLKVPLAEGTTARLDAVRRDGEDRLSVIRRAIETELTRLEAERRSP